MGRPSVACTVLATLALCQLELARAACTPQVYPKTGALPQAVNFSGAIRDLQWLGYARDADQYVFAIPEERPGRVGGELWRSDSYGAPNSWKNMTDSLPGLFDPPGNNASHWSPFRGAYALHHHGGQAHKLLLVGAGGNNWVSDNFGRDWERVSGPGNGTTLGFWTEYKLHPSQGDWMLALVRRSACMRSWSQLDKSCASDLFPSQDFARSWSNLTLASQGRIASFLDFDWGTRFSWSGSSSGKQPDETIFATAYEDPKHMKGPLPAWDRNVHYVMSRNFFTSSHEKLVSCGNQFDILNNKVYLAVPSNCPYGPTGSKRKLSAEDRLASSVILYESDDEGTSFTETCLPMGDLDLGYHMRGTFFGEDALLLTRHDTESVSSANAPVSTVYTLARNSSLFSVGATRIFRRGQTPDFVSLDGLPGMYIANRLGLEALTDAAFHPGGDETDWEKFVHTEVSYNGGAHWRWLEPPRNTTHPQCATCNEEDEWDCKLHLHGPSSYAAGEGRLPGLHSHWTAPGTLMAVGNVGQYLSFAKDYTCTFLSRDGGESWQDIDPRAMVFEFGDAGGIMMMAPHQSEEPADEVMFSMDEGSCWHTIRLSEAIDVIGIKVEPTASSHIFLVWGVACFKDEMHPNCTHTEAGEPPAGKMFALDVEQLMGNEWQVCGDDAYERWSVPSPERCLLGRNITSTRRKADAACFNGKGYEMPQGINNFCECEKLDTECDYGYEFSWRHNGTCQPIAGFNLDSCPHVRDRSYVISQSGMRLLGGDACTNLSRIINDTDGKGHSTLPRFGHWPHWLLIAGGLVVASAVILGVMQLISRAGPGSNAVETVAAPFFSLYEAVRARLPGRRNQSSEYYPLSEN